VEILLKVFTNDRIVSIIDDELDITELFRDSICGNIDGISVAPLTIQDLLENTLQRISKIMHLFFSDLRMPSPSGLELLKRIKNSSPNVRTILMSAYNFELDE